MPRLVSALLALAFAFGSGSASPLGDLAADPTWLKLGRWDRSPSLARSNVITESFFLAPDGARNPQAELEATLEGLRGPIGPDADQHVLCRFPARAIFLDEALGLGIPDPFLACPGLSAWSKKGGLDAVSVIFVAGYFSNPGSAFGHLLLRLHAGEDIEDVADVLDTAINYGARQSEEDPLPVYIARGLTGRYHSTYSSLDFYHHNERFRTEQLRDIWEYRLDLGPAKTRLLIAHIWEMLQAENRYYFLLQNCGYRVAELLELVVDRELIPSTKLWMAPVDVVDGLAREEDGKRAVSAIRRLPSRETAFRDGYARLSAKEKALVDQASASQRPLGALLADTGVDDPRPSYDVLLDYLAFQPETPEITARQDEVLAARFALPPSAEAGTNEPVSPDAGQASSMIGGHLLYNDERGAGVALHLRPAYFDFLSVTEGTAAYSELAMADLTLIARQDGLHVRRLDAVRVASLGLAGDGAPNRQARAFRVRFGAETRELSCDSCLLAFGEAAFGEAVEIAPNVAVYGFLGGRLEAGERINDSLSGTASVGVLVPGQHVGFMLEAAIQQGITDPEMTRPMVRSELRFRRTLMSDGGLTFAHDGTSEVGLVYRRYW